MAHVALSHLCFIARFTAGALLLTSAGSAATITLISQDHFDPFTVFSYGITTGPTEDLTIQVGQQIIFSGLSDITAVYTTDTIGPYFLSSNTLTTATFTQNAGTNLGFFPGNMYGTLAVSSISPAVGLVNYQINSLSGIFTGTVLGPVAVPEPATVALFGFGLAGLATLRRRWALLMAALGLHVAPPCILCRLVPLQMGSLEAACLLKVDPFEGQLAPNCLGKFWEACHRGVPRTFETGRC